MTTIWKGAVVMLLCAFIFTGARAQTEATLHFMPSIPQISYNNPAFTPNYKFSLGLPGSSVFVQATNSGINYKKFTTETDGKLSADLRGLYNSLDKKNYIGVATQADILRISMKINPRLYLTLNATAKVYSRGMLPQDFVGLFQNAQELIGTQTTIEPELEAVGYLEMAIAGAYKVNDRLSVGLRVKRLAGLANTTTAGSSLAISNLNNTTTVSAAVDVKTSGLTDTDMDWEDAWSIAKNNTGFAFDVGGTYMLSDRITVGLSLIDVGGIRWHYDTYGYQLNPATATYSFPGLDLNRIINRDDDYINELEEDIGDTFKFTEGTIESYRTPLPTKMYLSGAYQLRKTVTIGALFFAETFRNRFAPGFSASIQKEFGRRLSTSLSYTINNRSFSNVGAGIAFNLAPIQIYLVSDNLLGPSLTWFSTKDEDVLIERTRYFNMRVGLNFIFGRDKVQEKQLHP